MEMRYFVGGTGASATIRELLDDRFELVIYDYKNDEVENRIYETYHGARTALGIFSCGFQHEVTREKFLAFDRYEWCKR